MAALSMLNRAQPHRSRSGASTQFGVTICATIYITNPVLEKPGERNTCALVSGERSQEIDFVQLTVGRLSAEGGGAER
jgi:hypothetical protein